MKIKIIAVFAVLTLVISLLAGCSFGGGGNGGEPETTTVDIFSLYDNFAKVKVLEFEDAIYSRSAPNVDNIIIARCEVVEDWFGNMEKGSEIYLAFGLSYHTQEWIGVDALKNLLSSNDYILTAFNIIKGTIDYFKEGETLITDEFDGVVISEPVSIFQYTVFPMKDGKIDLSAIDSLYLECNKNETKPRREFYTTDYDDYFRDGMTEAEVKESAELLNERIAALKENSNK